MTLKPCSLYCSLIYFASLHVTSRVVVRLCYFATVFTVCKFTLQPYRIGRAVEQMWSSRGGGLLCGELGPRGSSEDSTFAGPRVRLPQGFTLDMPPVSVLLDRCISRPIMQQVRCHSGGSTAASHACTKPAYTIDPPIEVLSPVEAVETAFTFTLQHLWHAHRAEAPQPYTCN